MSQALSRNQINSPQSIPHPKSPKPLSVYLCTCRRNRYIRAGLQLLPAPATRNRRLSVFIRPPPRLVIVSWRGFSGAHISHLTKLYISVMDFAVIYIDAHTGHTFTSRVYKYRVCTYTHHNTRGGRERGSNGGHSTCLSLSFSLPFCVYFFPFLLDCTCSVCLCFHSVPRWL